MSWQLASFALLAIALASGLGWYERTQPTAKMLALVATLAALAALGRVAFAALPNVKPTTDIVLLSGFALGAAPGFAVGAIGGLASNLFFGFGPHTPWQMAAWGGAGLFGAVLARAFGPRLGRWPLAAACGAAGLAFGAWMDLSLWVLYTTHSTAEYWVISARSLPFNVAMVAGNVVFCLLFGPALVRALTRFRDRFDIVWHPAPAAASAALVAVLLLAVPASAADRSVRSAAEYVAASQTAAGGMASERGGRSANPLHSGWAALGLAAAGRHPADVRRGGRSLAAYLRAQRVSDVGDMERTILALRAAGQPTAAMTRRLLARRRADGSWERLVNRTAFGVLALRAAGRSPRDPAVRAAVRWLLGQQNPDGGFNVNGRGGESGVDDTSAAVQALAAGGRRRSAAVRRASAWMVLRQGRDGGFPLVPGTPSNAQSTAWAIQALVAAGRNPATVRRNGSRSPLAYLRSLQSADGSVRYSRTSAQTPTWVTAQALAALARKALPIAPPPRSRATAAAAPAAPAAEREREPAKPKRPTGTARARPAAGQVLSAQLIPTARRAGALAALLLGA